MLKKLLIFDINLKKKLQGQPRKLLEPKKATTARAPFSVKDPNQVCC